MPPKKPNGQRPVRLLRAAPTRKSPAFITPMAAQVVKKLPEGADWVYELKFDGYRALVVKDDQRVEIRSRKNKDLTGMYRGIAAAGQRVNAEQAVIDGEIVALAKRPPAPPPAPRPLRWGVRQAVEFVRQRPQHPRRPGEPRAPELDWVTAIAAFPGGSGQTAGHSRWRSCVASHSLFLNEVL